ncbi:STAS domain-containing protein [Comamonas serinivorans]|uniref:STAS domain-containing protein n=1 Tax=Comamonas serinivorans TaxID=1082851 RepID=UPI0012FC8572|nr:STAS domain-containing protein [Comamonas serinivorans]
MSKESSSGLLSKMVKFVRNPRTDWADLETADAARSDLEEEASKQQLREMLERKRQNDFVRKREFDTLRKLRNKEIDPPQAMLSPSFFPSSEPAESDGDKQNTLEKIAVIEAQMASQWFKSQGAALKARALQTRQGTLESARDSVQQPEVVARADEGVDPAAFAPTQTLEVPPSAIQRPVPPMPAPVPTPAVRSLDQPMLGDGLLPLGMSAAYESSQFEVAELVNHPEVEEIAILYANGETTAAEEALLRMISPTGGRRESAESWMTLFDLYRATGQHLRFDDVGIEFAAVFGRSAPVWYSVPDQLAARGAQVDDEPAPAGSNTSHWTANSSLSMQNLALLDTLPQRVEPPWRLDWRYVKRIDPGCAQALAHKLNAWADDRQVKLRFVGADNALRLLTELTPVADASVPQDLWALRLAMMRILGLMDDFELNALNFCVTFEVSPPAWSPPRCECLQIQPDGAVDEVAMAASAPVPAPALTTLPGYTESAVRDSYLDVTVARASLAGQVLGDASSQFAGLAAVDGVAETIEVDCRHVQRVDFVAAGTLLNWVADHQAKGQAIAFNNVNRLVAIFFRIIGIRELARVNVRQE